MEQWTNVKGHNALVCTNIDIRCTLNSFKNLLLKKQFYQDVTKSEGFVLRFSIELTLLLCYVIKGIECFLLYKFLGLKKQYYRYMAS